MKKFSLKLLMIISIVIALSAAVAISTSAYYDNYYCDHDFEIVSVDGYIVNLECSNCQYQDNRQLPVVVNIYNVSDITEYGISYGGTIPTEFSVGDKITLYMYSGAVSHGDLELTANKTNVVRITKIEHTYYDNIYEIEFKKASAVNITVKSAYNSDLEYETLSFTPRCDHNFRTQGVDDYVLTKKCTKCNLTQTGSIPSYVRVYNVSSYSSNGINYSSYIPSSFDRGDTLTICVEPGYANYDETEFIVTNPEVLQISRVNHDFYDLYTFRFKKEGMTSVIVTSEYDNSVVYKIMTFVSNGYDTFYTGSISYTGETDQAGDVDGNGAITTTDARHALRLSARLSTCNLTTKQYADANGNGKITTADARLILRVAARLESADSLSEFYVVDSENSYGGDSINMSQTVSIRKGETLATDTYIMRGRNVTITSSNTAVAKIDNATKKIKAVKKGYACVTITNGTETYEYEVFVVDNNTSLEDYTNGTPEINMGTGESFTVDYVIIRNPRNLTWRSSNTAVATVDQNGKIRAIRKGFACIIVTNGTETCYYNVNVKNELQQRIDLYREKYPHGYYWNNHTPSQQYPNVSEQPCTDHPSRTYQYCKGQCAGFADLMFREVYGRNARKNYGVTWSTIEIGDYIRLNPHHSVFVTDVVKQGDIIGYNQWTNQNIVAERNYIVVVHCNWGSCCNIAWDDIFYEGSYSINSSASYSAQ